MTRARRRVGFLYALRKQALAPLAPPDTYDPQQVAAMLREIGIGLIEVSQPTPNVETRLRQIAEQYTTQSVRVAALPTLLLIQIGDETYQFDRIARSTSQLDAAGRIDAIATLAQAGAITPAAAVSAVEKARTQPPRFGALATIGGYAITTLGFGMVINPTWSALPTYVILGLVVGGIVQLSRPFPTLSAILPTLAATAATILAIDFLDAAAHDELLRVISPALVATLPGMALTIGAMELASSQIIAGSSRMIYGISQLAMLLFGVAIGVRIAGWMDTGTQAPLLGEWSLYVAIVVISIGLSIYLSAPAGSLFWMMAAIAVALLTQTAAATVLPASPSGFVGAFLSVPFAMLASKIRSSPPAIVMLLSAFWSLVPGALSFVSVGQAASGDAADFESLAATGAAILSIALGTLVGWSVFYTIESRFPWAKAAPAPQ